MPIRRTYAEHGDACRAANALDLVGEKWTLVIVRELILGPRRFAELQTAVRGITPAVLTERLRSLQEAGIVKQVRPDGAGGQAYVATAWGRGLENVLRALGRWYSAGPDPVTTGEMTPDAMILAMRTMAPASPGMVPAVALWLNDARRPDAPVRGYAARATDDGALEVAAGEVTDPAATVTATATAWSSVLLGGVPLDDAERDGRVHVEGDRSAVVRLVELFATPVSAVS
ncbi:winged helix-turn-helix transcriptional regulator [Georgenia alba]|uniref:Winged helix-turn-helix transcriptional regulator n=1 Tax=Georgenia alba TaxID=2233858 RepID=A0ABW2Q6G7_9MICO